MSMWRKTIPIASEQPEDRRHQAACPDEDPELFFPLGTSGPALIQTEQAKAVCRRCPVRDDCLTWALETNQEFGVWGGMSEDERRGVKRGPGRRMSGPEYCANGHEWTKANTYRYPGGGRACRICASASKARSRQTAGAR